MNINGNSSVRKAASWAMTLGLLVVMLFSAVSPAYAATLTISSITVAAKPGTPVYGTVGTASFDVTVTATGTGTLKNVSLSVAGLSTGLTYIFSPAAKISFNAAGSKTVTLTITTTATTPAGPDGFTVHYKLPGSSKFGSVYGTGTLNVAPRPLTIGGKLIADKDYDGTTAAAFNPICGTGPECYTLTGLVNGDAVTLDTVSASAVFASKNVGLQSVTVSNLKPSSTNYSLSPFTTPTATISPVPLLVLPYSVTLGINDPDPTGGFHFAYGAFLAGDTPATAIVKAPTCDDYNQGTNTLASDVLPRTAGLYDIVCAGGSATNYVLDFSQRGTLTVSSSGAPHVAASPNPLNFGYQLLGTASLPKTITVTNNASGPVSLGITGMSLVGTQFSLITTGSTCYNGTAWAKSLGQGASCTVNVKFSPTAAGTFNGGLKIVSNDAANPEYTVVLIGNSSPGVQILLNRSFENDLNADKIPDRWGKRGVWSVDDGRDCSVHYNGKCSLKFVANGQLNILQQSLTKSGVKGSGITFFLYSKALNVPTNAQYNVRVLLFNGTTLVGSKIVNFAKGTHGFKIAQATFTAPANYTRIVFRITFKASAGTVWFDLGALKR